MAITELILGLAPYNYFHSIENKILVKIKPKRDTKLQKKIEQSSFNLGQNSRLFFHFFGLKGLNF